MNWFLWLLVAWYVANIVISIALIDKEREPYTPGQVVVMVLIFLSLIVGVLWTGGVFA